MKKTALFMASAMSLTLIVPLAACGGSGKFDLNNYIEDSKVYEGDWTSATKLDEKYSFDRSLDEESPVVIVNDSSNTTNGQVLYNVETKAEIGNHFTDVQTCFGTYIITSIAGAPGSADGEVVDPEYTYDVYSMWGDVIATGISSEYKPTAHTNTTALINGQLHYIQSVTYTTKVTQGEGDEVTLYFSLDKTSVNDEKPTLVKYTEEEIKAADASVYTAGQTVDDLNADREYLGTVGQKGALDSYECAFYENVSGGMTVVFYKDGKRMKKEAVLPSNAALITSVGTSVIYSVTTSVDPYATEGYNVLTDNGYSATKTNVEYFRYNIKNGKTSKIKTDFYLDTDEVSPLYNKKKETYDLVAATVVPFEDGVAHVGGSNQVSRTVLLNEKGKVVCDYSDKPFSIEGCLKLTDKRFLALNESTMKMYLVDNKLNVIATLPVINQNQVSFSLQRIMLGVGDSALEGPGDVTYYEQNRMIDFDGKVISDNLYGMFIGFYGDKAVVSDVYNSATDVKPVDKDYEDGYLVSADGTYKKVNDVFTAATDSNPAQLAEGLVFVDKGVYNYAGTKLTDVATVDMPTFEFTYHNCAIVTIGTESFIVAR